MHPPLRGSPDLPAPAASQVLRDASDLHGVVAVNAALVVRNLELLDLLAQQHVALDALQALVVSVAHAVQTTRGSAPTDPRRTASRLRLSSLTARQREVLTLVVSGHPSKRIAATLGISQRTVENHRASIMTKTGTISVPALTQLALIAGVLS